MLTTQELILQLTKQLYPTGRAWNMPKDGTFEALHKALAVSEAQAFDDAVSILDSLLPDTDRFTESDATDWERRLGIATGTGTSLADRKAAILQKLQAPGRNPAKAHYLYIQQQLQLAGFDVYVHENLVPAYPDTYESVGPNSLYGNANFVTLRHGQRRHGQVNHAGYYNNIIANSIYQSVDSGFNIGSSFRCTFFIGGQTLGTYTNVPAEREIEFRQLILRLKPVQNIGFLFINYI
jgi:hypothetical protein